MTDPEGGPCTCQGCDEPGTARIFAQIGDGDAFQIMNSSTDPHTEVLACAVHLPEALHRFASILQERYPQISIRVKAEPIQSDDDEPTANGHELDGVSGVQPNRRDRRRLDRYARRSARATGPGRH